MADQSVATQQQLGTSPWRRSLLTVQGGRCPPETTLLLRLVGVCVLLRAWWQLSGVFLPFTGGGDRPSGQALTVALRLLALVLALMLALNQHVPITAFGLGCLVLGQVAASHTYYENNRTFAGLVLVLGSLSAVTWVRAVRWQVLLLYGAAALNKALDVDWRSGRYLDQLSTTSAVLRALLHAVPLARPAHVAIVMSWAVIVVEAGLVVAFLLPRLRPAAIWVGLSYHTSLVLTTHRTFGMFWYVLAASYLAFVRWPTEPLVLHVDPGRTTQLRLARLLDRLDVDGALALADGPLSARAGTRTVHGWAALLAAALRVPAVLLTAMALLALPEARLDYAGACAVMVVLMAVLWTAVRSRRAT